MKARAAAAATVAVLSLPGSLAKGQSGELLQRTAQLQAETDYWRALARERGARIRKLLRLRRADRRAISTQRRSLRFLVGRVPFGNHWLDSAFLCIHGGEGPWNSHTGNGYENGLQMDRGFQLTYGREWFRLFGPAWRWPAAVQMAVAMKAYKLGRGFRPWPRTARMCGLL